MGVCSPPRDGLSSLTVLNVVWTWWLASKDKIGKEEIITLQWNNVAHATLDENPRLTSVVNHVDSMHTPNMMWW